MPAGVERPFPEHLSWRPSRREGGTEWSGWRSLLNSHRTRSALPLVGVNGKSPRPAFNRSSPCAHNAEDTRPSAQLQILRQSQARWIGRCRTCADAEASRHGMAVGVGILPSVPPGLIRSRQTAELIRAVGNRQRQVGRMRAGRGLPNPGGEVSRGDRPTVRAVDTAGARPSCRRG